MDCVLHQGAKRGRGYGKTKDGEYAHRAAYRQAYGEIPAGHLVHHTCGVKLCINPDHLIALPNARAHAQRHRKTHCKHGHEFTPQNTWIDKHGSRHCRICRRDALRRFTGWPRVRQPRTHCFQGHEYTPENTGHTSDGKRFCLKCRRETLEAWKQSPAGIASRDRRNAKRREARRG